MTQNNNINDAFDQFVDAAKKDAALLDFENRKNFLSFIDKQIAEMKHKYIGFFALAASDRAKMHPDPTVLYKTNAEIEALGEKPDDQNNSEKENEMFNEAAEKKDPIKEYESDKELLLSANTEAKELLDKNIKVSMDELKHLKETIFAAKAFNGAVDIIKKYTSDEKEKNLKLLIPDKNFIDLVKLKNEFDENKQKLFQKITEIEGDIINTNKSLNESFIRKENNGRNWGSYTSVKFLTFPLLLPFWGIKKAWAPTKDSVKGVGKAIWNNKGSLALGAIAGTFFLPGLGTMIGAAAGPKIKQMLTAKP